MPDWSSWTPYIQSGLALTAGYLVKNSVQQGKDLVELKTTVKYYVERQTADALQRLDKGNPAPQNIVALARRRIKGESLTALETRELTNWLRWAGREDSKIDPAERSAALQLLTGFRTTDQLHSLRKRWWWFW